MVVVTQPNNPNQIRPYSNRSRTDPTYTAYRRSRGGGSSGGGGSSTPAQTTTKTTTQTQTEQQQYLAGRQPVIRKGKLIGYVDPKTKKFIRETNPDRYKISPDQKSYTRSSSVSYINSDYADKSLELAEKVYRNTYVDLEGRKEQVKLNEQDRIEQKKFSQPIISGSPPPKDNSIYGKLNTAFSNVIKTRAYTGRLPVEKPIGKVIDIVTPGTRGVQFDPKPLSQGTITGGGKTYTYRDTGYNPALITGGAGEVTRSPIGSILGSKAGEGRAKLGTAGRPLGAVTQGGVAVWELGKGIVWDIPTGLYKDPLGTISGTLSTPFIMGGEIKSKLGGGSTDPWGDVGYYGTSIYLQGKGGKGIGEIGTKVRSARLRYSKPEFPIKDLVGIDKATPGGLVLSKSPAEVLKVFKEQSRPRNVYVQGEGIFGRSKYFKVPETELANLPFKVPKDYDVVHLSGSTGLKSSKEIKAAQRQAVKSKKPKQEDPYLFVTPKGSGQPRFLYVEELGKGAKYDFTLNPFKTNKPTIYQIAVQDIKGFDPAVLKAVTYSKGGKTFIDVPKIKAYYDTLPTGEVRVTARRTLGHTPEFEGNLPGQKLFYDIPDNTFIGRFKSGGWAEYKGQIVERVDFTTASPATSTGGLLEGVSSRSATKKAYKIQSDPSYYYSGGTIPYTFSKYPALYGTKGSSKQSSIKFGMDKIVNYGSTGSRSSTPSSSSLFGSSLFGSSSPSKSYSGLYYSGSSKSPSYDPGYYPSSKTPSYYTGGGGTSYTPGYYPTGKSPDYFGGGGSSYTPKLKKPRYRKPRYNPDREMEFRGVSYRRYGARKKYRYTPSFTSFIFDIRGKAPKKTITGFEARPIPKDWSWARVNRNVKSPKMLQNLFIKKRRKNKWTTTIF